MLFKFFSKEYRYRVKVLRKKKQSVVRDIHKFNGKFTSIIEIKACLMEELEDEVPPTTKFSLGVLC